MIIVMTEALRRCVFRANVGALLFRDDGMVLAFERLGKIGAWQFPQGGLDPDEESVRAAVFRELEEETGLTPDDVQLVAEHPLWLGYEVPLALYQPWMGRGQVQKWFALRVCSAESVASSVNLATSLNGQHQEFQAFRWMLMDDLTRCVVDFKRPVYQELGRWLRETVLPLATVANVEQQRKLL